VEVRVLFWAPFIFSQVFVEHHNSLKINNNINFYVHR
jgi:hypothetical protein